MTATKMTYREVHLALIEKFGATPMGYDALRAEVMRLAGSTSRILAASVIRGLAKLDVVTVYEGGTAVVHTHVVLVDGR